MILVNLLVEETINLETREDNKIEKQEHRVSFAIVPRE